MPSQSPSLLKSRQGSQSAVPFHSHGHGTLPYLPGISCFLFVTYSVSVLKGLMKQQSYVKWAELELYKTMKNAFLLSVLIWLSGL